MQVGSSYIYVVNGWEDTYTGESDVPIAVRVQSNVKFKTAGKGRVLYIMDEGGKIVETRLTLQAWSGPPAEIPIVVREGRLYYVLGNEEILTRCTFEDSAPRPPLKFYLSGRTVMVRDAQKMRFYLPCTFEDLQVAAR